VSLSGAQIRVVDMGLSETADVTILLDRWSQGDRSALEALAPIVYGELHRLAVSRLRNERAGHTLAPTALIHEAYLRLVGHDQRQWHGRAHFYAVASCIMREILVDNARRHRAAKRGSGNKVPLEGADWVSPERGRSLEELDDALKQLSRLDDRKGRLIELKYFGGFKGEEISEILSISISTITREMRLAEAWLESYLSPPLREECKAGT
jgi:RNA polymerase sigma-70 factor, ECF subfamily